MKAILFNGMGAGVAIIYTGRGPREPVLGDYGTVEWPVTSHPRVSEVVTPLLDANVNDTTTDLLFLTEMFPYHVRAGQQRRFPSSEKSPLHASHSMRISVLRVFVAPPRRRTLHWKQRHARTAGSSWRRKMLTAGRAAGTKKSWRSAS